MKRRVADIIMDVLVEHGIVDCFAVVGGGAMHLDNALALNKKINKYFNHHEQACAMAAEAYARISGNMAMVCVTSGPGATNAITGVMGAWQDSIPMIVLSGQVRYETSMAKTNLKLRYRGIQEFDIIHSVQNMTKYAVMITDPLMAKYEIEKALNIAYSGRRGPVWLDIPLDVQSAIVEENDMFDEPISLESYPACTEDLDFIIDKIQNAQRPCILVGNGVANTGNIESFRMLAKILRVPVIAAAIAADAMYSEYDRYYGLSGCIGPRTGNFILQNADVIFSIGCSLGYKTTGFAQEQFAPNAYIMAIDIDENEFKKPGVRVDKFIRCDITDFFKKAIPQFTEIVIDKKWLHYCDNLKNRFSPYEGGENSLPNERVCMYHFWQKYGQHEKDNSISVLGNNTANSAKLQIGIRKASQRIVANNNCGSMGVDLPEAIGAAVASKREVICLTGDGSIMMNLQELQTIVHNQLPIKIIIFSNDGYGAIKQTSNNYFDGLRIGCDLESGVSFPQFSSMAEAFGYEYRNCRCNAELDDCLEWIFGRTAPSILEVQQKFDDPVVPRLFSRVSDKGTNVAPLLQDMYPFLDEEEYSKLMLW